MSNDRLGTKRLDNLDLMKVLAILAVLSLHVEVWDTDFVTAGKSINIIQYAWRLVAEGVPIFMMVNGYLLLRKQKLDMGRHLKKIGKIFLLLVIWAAILTIVGNALSEKPESLTISMLVKYILSTRLFSEYTGVLWFLEFLIAIYLVYPMLWKTFKADFCIYQYIFIILAGFSIGISIIAMVRDALQIHFDVWFLTDAIDLIGILSPFGTIKGGFIWYLLYFMLGGMVYHYEEYIKNERKTWIAIGILSWLLELIYGITLSRASGYVYDASFPYNTGLISFWIVSMFALTLPYKNNNKWYQKCIAAVGRRTFGIYLSHYIFKYVYEKVYIAQTFLERVVEFAIVFLLSYLFTLVIEKTPYIRKLIII